MTPEQLKEKRDELEEKQDELKKIIAIKDEAIRSQEKHIDKLCGIIDEYRAMLELPLPDQAGA